MKSAWTKHLKTEEERSRFANSIIGSKLVLERLYDILEEEEKNRAEELGLSASYDSPNWAYKAADSNGYRRALRTVKSIINLDQQKAIHD